MAKIIFAHYLQISFILMLFGVSCQPFKKADLIREYFSGEIEYKITFDEIDSESKNIWFYKQAYGNAMKLTIAQNGDFVKKYFNSGNYGRDYNYYNVEENTFYAKYKNIDTIYALRADGDDILTLEKEGQVIKENVLENSCKGWSYECSFDTSLVEDVSGKMKVTYFYTDFYKINSKNHKNINDVIWQQHLERSNGSYPLKIIRKLSSYRLTFTATDIEQKNIKELDKQQFLQKLPIVYIY